jgi:hypothetical protein
MRPLRLPASTLLLWPLALGACTEECPTADFVLNGRSWNIFNTVVELSPPELDPAFPGETSPANGAHVFTIDWNTNAPDSAVTVTIDGQEFPGQGRWDDANCGEFNLAFEGTYVAGEVLHDFAAGASLETWDEHLEGTWRYAEAWRTGDLTGRVDFQVQMKGTP